MIPPSPTYQSNKPRPTNQKTCSWANGFFRIEGFAGKSSLLPLPHPPPSSFLLSTHFPRVPNTKTPSRARYVVRLVRERLLRRLIISNITTVFLIYQQVGNILNSHVTYGGILPLNSTSFLQCFRKYIETEEQWLFHILAENTGNTQVRTRCLCQTISGFYNRTPGKGIVFN